MKKNRRILSVLLAAIMVFALAGCGGAEGKKESQKKVADDTAVLGMSFLAPEQFETVERSVEKTTEGKLISKVIGGRNEGSGHREKGIQRQGTDPV